MSQSSLKKRRKSESLEDNSICEIISAFDLSLNDKYDFFDKLRSLYLSNSLCDVSFNVRGQIFHAHKIVLAASSGYLSGMFLSGMIETEMREIPLDEDPTLFKYILEFVYGITIRMESSKIVPLLSIASAYAMITLRDMLADKLEHHLTVENACVVLLAAESYNCEKLTEHAKQKIFSNFAAVCKTLSFCELPLPICYSLCSSDDILDCDEAIVFEAVISINHIHYINPLLNFF